MMRNMANPFEINENSMFHPKTLQSQMESNQRAAYNNFMIAEPIQSSFGQNNHTGGRNFFN